MVILHSRVTRVTGVEESRHFQCPSKPRTKIAQPTIIRLLRDHARGSVIVRCAGRVYIEVKGKRLPRADD